MSSLTRASPFVLIGGAFALGIVFASIFAPSLYVLLAMTAVGGLGWLYSSRQENARSLVWSFALLTLFTLGAWRYVWGEPKPTDRSAIQFAGNLVILEGVVDDAPDVRESHVNLRVRPTRIVRAREGGATVNFDDLVLVRADKSTPWKYGDVIRVEGFIDVPPRISDFDYREYLARDGVFVWMPKPSRTQRIDHTEPSLFWSRLFDLRDFVRGTVTRILPAPESALLNGILIGDDNALPQDIRVAFQKTGTSHVVAISGYNINIVIGFVLLLLLRFFHRRQASLILIGAIALYTLFVGASASVVRAATMASLGLFGLFLWRRGFTTNTLFAAAFLILAFKPLLLFDIGFQLSCAATLGLILYSEWFADKTQRWIDERFDGVGAKRAITIVVDTFAMTIAAQVATLPLLLTYFRQLSLISLFANLLVVPLQPPIMVLGFMAVVAGAVSISFGSLVGLSAYPFLTLTLRVVEWMSRLPFAAIPVNNFGMWSVVAYYVALFSLLLWSNQTREERKRAQPKLRKSVVGFIAIAVLVLGGVWFYQRPDGKLRVIFSGKGAFAQTPSGKQIVFLGGDSLLAPMGRSMPLFDKTIEWMIAPGRDDRTRADALVVLRAYEVEQLIQPAGLDEPTPMSDEWNRLIRQGVRSATTSTVTLQIEPDITLSFDERIDVLDSRRINAMLVHGKSVIYFVFAPPSELPAQVDVLFAATRIDKATLNEAKPRYVIGAETVNAMFETNNRTRTFSLREGKIEFVSDGQTIVSVDVNP
jgi:competence protein ComEC